MAPIEPTSAEHLQTIDAIRRIAESGLTEQWREGCGLSLLHLVAMTKNLAGLQLLLSKGWRPNILIESSSVSMFNGMSPLHFATLCGRAECVEVLLDANASPNGTSKLGLRPLHFACVGNDSAAEYLLMSGANPNARDSDDETPFIHACGAANGGSFASDRLIELMLEKGANPMRAKKNGLTALHLAALEGKDHWVVRFLELGIDVNRVTALGDTALHFAARMDHPSTCLLLIQNGAKLDDRNKAGKTPLSLALEQSASEVIKVLLEHGASGSVASRKALGSPRGKLNVSWDDVYLALVAHRTESADQMVDALIRSGADIQVQDEQGITPLHICFLPNYLDHLDKEIAGRYSDLVL